MSFTARDVHDWLGHGGQPARLVRADGDPWSADADLAGVECIGAALDSRAVRPGSLFVGVSGERTHGAHYLRRALEAGAAAALVEGRMQPVPGRAAPVFLVDDGRTALGHLAQGYLASFEPIVVGITGTNGKTTTKDFLAASLAADRRVGANPGNLNSRLGLPVAVLGQSGQEELLILEMGASAPGEIEYLARLARPRIGCITNVSAAHLDGMGSLEGILHTKGALVEALPVEGVAVLNADDPSLPALRQRCRAERIVTFGRGSAADVRITRCEQTPAGLELEIDGVACCLPLFGTANGLNAAAAAAAARELGVPVAQSLPRMARSTLSPHRSRLIQVQQTVVLDDCYNANPVSMGQALESLSALPIEGRRVAVLGTMGELGDDSSRLHDEVLERTRSLGIDVVFVAGDAMVAAAERRGLSQDLRVAPGNLDDFGRQLAVATQPGDAVLLKGSRSVGLEIAVDSLVAALQTGGRD